MKPKYVYVAFCNKAGYVSEQPETFMLRDDKACWLGSAGCIGAVVKLGLMTDPAGEGKWFCFSSANKEETAAFILGARAMITLVHYGFGHVSFRKNEYQKLANGDHPLSSTVIKAKPLSDFQKRYRRKRKLRKETE